MKAVKLLIFITAIYFGEAVQVKSQVAPIKNIKTGKNGELIVNGKPFFMIASWAQPVKNYKLLQELGFNTHSGDVDPAAAKEGGCYTFTTGARIAKAPNDMILGIMYDDEPDLLNGRGDSARPRQTPEQVAEKVKQFRAKNPGRLIFIGITSNFMKEQSSLPAEYREKVYPQYVSNADILGFDIYPIYGSGFTAHLNWVGSGVSQLCALAGKRPVTAAIETSKGSKWMSYEKQPDVLPIHTRNEVWQAIINGASGITYFTHAWRPDFREFAPTPEMQKELKRLNSQITRLSPAILAGPPKNKIEMTMGDGLKCSFKATKFWDSIYIFSQNNDLGPGAEKAKQFEPIFPRTGKAVFTVKGLKSGTIIEVVDEQRTITAEDGKFSDEFAPLTEHIYRFKLKPSKGGKIKI
jgi:hypothetical protein